MRIYHMLAATTLLSCCSLAQASPNVTVSNNAAFFQGKYGTSQNINIFYDETDIQIADKAWRVKLTLPYLWVKNLPEGAQISTGSVVTHSASTQTRDTSGRGDVWLEGRYKIFAGAGLEPSVSPYLKIKFGTASASSGLGSGKNDYETGVMLQQVLTPKLFPFLKVGYRFVGKPIGLNYRNIATCQVGATYALSKKSFITPMLSSSQSLVRGGTNPVDAILAWNYNVTAKGSGFQLYVDKGLSTGSANYGVGIGGQIVF